MYKTKKQMKNIREIMPVNKPAVDMPAMTVSKDMGIPPDISRINSFDISSMMVASQPYMVGKHILVASAFRNPINKVDGSSPASPSCHRMYLLKPFLRNLRIIKEIPKAKKISKIGSMALMPRRVSIYLSE
jgi:hypothetical protein